MDISVGAHLASVNGDTLQVSFRGNVHQSDVLEFFRLAEQIMAEHGLYYVIADISGLGSILPDARRESAKWGPGKQVAGTVFFGGSVAARAVMTLTMRAVNLIRSDAYPVAFVKTEADAKAWLAAQRQKRSVR